MAARVSAALRKAEATLRACALAYPGAHEDFPWGERVVKAGGKVFVFLSAGPEGLSLTVKLPASSGVALMLPFVEPTGYGLGKSGWVTAHFAPRDAPPLPALRDWIDESYRAVAPKKLVAALAAPAPAAPAQERRKPARKGRGRTR